MQKLRLFENYLPNAKYFLLFYSFICNQLSRFNQKNKGKIISLIK